jgi:hypothetical protein
LFKGYEHPIVYYSLYGTLYSLLIQTVLEDFVSAGTRLKLPGKIKVGLECRLTFFEVDLGIGWSHSQEPEFVTVKSANFPSGSLVADPDRTIVIGEVDHII